MRPLFTPSPAPVPLVLLSLAALSSLGLPARAGAQGALAAATPSSAPLFESPPAQPAAAPSRRCCDLPISVPGVYLHSGEYHHEAVDLVVPGRGLDFVWQRSYRSRLGPNTEQGNGWSHSYDIRIRRAGRDLQLMDGNGRSDVLRERAANSWVAEQLFREGAFNADGTFSLLFEDRGEWRLEPLDGSPHEGKIRSISDRNGNTMSFGYDAQGRLVKITDTLGRGYTVAYRTDGFLGSVTDFTGRSVVYDYHKASSTGGAGDLASARSPIVTGTPRGNNFPAGKTTTYTYTAGFADERLNHNLLTITDPKGQTWLRNTYSPATDPEHPLFDRLVRQQRGEAGDVLDFCYVRPVLELSGARGDRSVASTAIVNDRMGNVTEFDYDRRGRCVAKREFTGRADPDRPTTPAANRPGHALRPGAPPFFETRWQYNADSRITRIVHPNGNVTEKVYELALSPGAPWRSRGNLRELRRLPGTHLPVGGQPILVERFSYAAGFGSCCGTDFATSHVDARGAKTEHDYDAAGNRLQTRHPIAGIVEDFTYNAFGQLLAHVWPDNGSGARRIDAFTYYSRGSQVGYLASRTVDSAGLALTTTWSYDAAGNVVQATDPRGNVWSFHVNQLNQVVRRTSPPVQMQNTATVQYETDIFFDANDNVVQVDVQNFDHDGVPSANTYFTTSYDYDVLDRRTRTTEECVPGQVVTEYAYDANGNLTLTRLGEATSGRQPTNVVRRLYDERDLLWLLVRAEGDPDQSTAQYDYDGNRNLVRFLEGLEGTPRVEAHVYDAYDRLVRATDAMGNATVHEYDGNGNVTRTLVEGELCDVAGGAGNVRLSETSHQYDPMDRAMVSTAQHFDPATQQPIGDGTSVRTLVWTAASQLASTTDDNGNTTVFSYDGALRRATRRDARGNLVQTDYDACDNVVKITHTEKSDAGRPDEVFVTTRVYDAVNRLFSERDPVQSLTKYGYDSRNDRTLLIDALGNRTETSYDGLRRRLGDVRILTDTGTGAGNAIGKIATAQSWDDSSRLIDRTDPNGNVTSYVYDALGRQVATRWADATSDSRRYDVHDNEIGRTDQNGTTVAATYDLANRLGGRVIAPAAGVSSDTTAETWKFDGLSRLVLAQDDDSTVARTWDSLSALLTETQNGQVIAYSRDGMGNAVGLVYPGGKQVRRTFDALNRIKTITNNGPAAAYAYVGPTRVEMRTTGKKVAQSSYVYDGARRMVHITHNAGGLQLDVRGFEWSPMYHKTQATDERTAGPGTVHDYAYDSGYRMVRALVSDNGGPLSDTRYSLDEAGNRQSVAGGGCPGTYVMDPTLPAPADFQVNQYTSTPCIGGLGYDANGSEIVRSGVGALLRDCGDRIVQHLDLGSGGVTRYAYDALGRRILKIRPGGTPADTTRYLYDGWHVVEERDGNDVVTATWVRGQAFDEIVEMARAGQTYFFFADDLGSVRVVTDASGKPVERYEYGHYGMPAFLNGSGGPIASTAIGNAYLFTGQRWDAELGFYDFKTRHLDPLAGRFVARDRIGMWGDEGNLGNGLTYVGNNPATWIDPLGLDFNQAANIVLWMIRTLAIPNPPGVDLEEEGEEIVAENPNPADGGEPGKGDIDLKLFLLKQKGGAMQVQTPYFKTFLGKSWNMKGKGVETVWNPNPEDLYYDAGIPGHGSGGGIDLDAGSIQEQLKSRGKKGKGSGGKGDDSGDDPNAKGNSGASSGEDFPGPDELVNPVPVIMRSLREIAFVQS